MKIKLVNSKNQSCCLSNKFEDIPNLEDDIYEWYEKEEGGMDDLCKIINSYSIYSVTWFHYRSNSRRIQFRYLDGGAMGEYVLLIYLEEE